MARWLSGQRYLLPNLITCLIPRAYMMEEENHFLQVRHFIHVHVALHTCVCTHTYTKK